MKFKLSLLVVFTSSLAFIMAGGSGMGLHSFVIFIMGGFLVTGSANALNQIIEKDYDSLMSRTKDRPVASGRMAISFAILLAGAMCISGLLLLAYFNTLTALLGALSVISYAFIYTPLKRYSPIAVFVGAFPGALPVLIGCVAVTGEITTFALLLFAIQFFWQFPHFWAIGWLSFDDYKKAGFKLVPVVDGKIDAGIGKQSLFYTIMILPASILFYLNGFIPLIGLILLLVGAVYFIYKAYLFFKEPSDFSARKLLYASLYFLPIIFSVLLFNMNG
ncbi:heme o synthase [Membranihabitans marinus]|uniref:heme o synthase n=1 Tax=Membranihabitans marinus TaxID=1227546 RepID=UPI001EFF865D|nr:heme o synthase [Membranihabitans marinus]